MSTLPADRDESTFRDYKPAYTEVQAQIEANRCLFCEDAPCVTACPTHIDIPGFIRKISTGNLRGSARSIFEANILGMSCARVCPVEVLCVGACVYGEMQVAPIEIGRLQRFTTDHAFDAGWRFFEAGADTGKSVGVVGAGPASLAAAHELRRLGHRVVIYERRSLPGGLNSTGVAPYKMRADRSLEEVEWVLAIGGIEVRHGVVAGEDVSWADLEREHDALFLGLGLGADRGLGVPGEDLPGVVGAVAFIERMKTGRVDLTGVRHAVVVGGGNTAIDGMRALIGLGVTSVTLVYRGDEEVMPGYEHEWQAARASGALALWRAMPIAFEGDGRVELVRCARMDERKQPIAGEESVIPADLVLLAIGQARLENVVRELEGVEVERGCIVVDASGATGRPGCFSGGDCANGGKEVVNAVAEGKAAARGIDRFMRGQ